MGLFRHVKILVAVTILIILAACGGQGAERTEDDVLRVVTSFTIIQDLAQEIGGEHVEVYNLVPTGTDPHEYEPLPEDMKHVTRADVLFYNGLNLEGGADGWFFKMVRTAGKSDDIVFSLTEGVSPMYIGGEDGHDTEINPHAFISPKVGIIMAEQLRDALKTIDPDRQDHYEQRAADYIANLHKIDQLYEARINDIPEQRRILITSERAFQYLAAHYGLREGFIWEIDTEENGSRQQIASLITFINQHDVPVLFVESNVDRRPMETVSRETGVPLASKPIYSDEIGKSGQEADTYVNYLNYNIELIHYELSKP